MESGRRYPKIEAKRTLSMHFKRPEIIRPPSEWKSYFLPLTSGCSNNTCAFCGYYGSKLQIREVGDAKKESSRIIEQARKNEAKFRGQIAQEMEEKAVEYGAEVFKLVFSERMGEQLHRQFMDELLDALSEIEGANITVDGDDAEFVSSFAFDDDQKTRFQNLLKDKFDLDIEVKEKVDSSLLAGMVFKLGSLEIDGSLRNRYQEAAQEVKKVAHQIA